MEVAPLGDWLLCDGSGNCCPVKRLNASDCMFARFRLCSNRLHPLILPVVGQDHAYKIMSMFVTKDGQLSLCFSNDK